MPGFDIVLAELSEDPISVDRATAAVQGDEAGAVVSFSGVVRNHDGGMAASRSSYSAHPTAHHILAGRSGIGRGASRKGPQAGPHLGRPPRRDAGGG